MTNKRVLIRKNSYLVCAGFEEEKLNDLIIMEEDSKLHVGDIYIGKVKNIIPNIQAAFVEVKKSLICYLPLSDFINGEKMYQGKELVVQIVKEAIKGKQPVVTTKINLSGKFSVITKGILTAGVSNRIESGEKRNQWQELAKKYCTDEYGIIIRTNAKEVEEKIVEQELICLGTTYKDIFEKAKTRTCFSLLYQDEPAYIKELRDSKSGRIDRIVTDQEDIYNELINLKKDGGIETGEITLYTDSSYSLDKLYGVSTKLEKLFQKKIWLKSGASIVIEHTEAMTCIDVNTSKAIEGKRRKEETFLKINIEASKEIARQLRLRNISGIILVDFIDLKEDSMNQKLLESFQKELMKDPVRATLVDMTGLGLVEVTRKKIKRPIYEFLNLI